MQEKELNIDVKEDLLCEVPHIKDLVESYSEIQKPS